MGELDFTKPERVRPAPTAPNIRVAHLSAAPKPYVYVGRQMPGIPASPLGNPYRGDGAIESFRAWLRRSYGAYVRQGDAAPQEAWAAGRELERLAEVYRAEGALTLACWCAPEPCHADVIADAVVGIVARDEPVLVGVEYAGECLLLPTPDGWELSQDGMLLRRAVSIAEARAPFTVAEWVARVRTRIAA